MESKIPHIEQLVINSFDGDLTIQDFIGNSTDESLIIMEESLIKNKYLVSGFPFLGDNEAFDKIHSEDQGIKDLYELFSMWN